MSGKRILLVGRPKSGKLSFLKALTGSLPPNIDSASHSGLSHVLKIETQYYKSDVGVWIDEISNSQDWAEAYAGSEAKEVLQVLGAFVYTFKGPQDEKELANIKDDLKALSQVVKACGYHWDGVCLAVGRPSGAQSQLQMSFQDWEDICQDYQFEYIDFEGRGRNDYGEPTGMERVQEALRANDWSGNELGEVDESILSGGSSDAEDINSLSTTQNPKKAQDGLKLEADEMEREMFGLHQALYESDGPAENEQEMEVEDLEKALKKLQVIKDMAGEVPEAERRKLAAKAVADIMKTL